MKIGDVVQLRSGGPKMTILDVVLLPKPTAGGPVTIDVSFGMARMFAEPILCGWFTDVGEFKEARFREAALLMSPSYREVP